MRVAACAGYFFLGFVSVAVYLLWNRKPRSMRSRATPNNQPAPATALREYIGAAERAKRSAFVSIASTMSVVDLFKNDTRIPNQPRNPDITRLANKQVALESQLCRALSSNHAGEIATARIQLMELLFTLSSTILDETLQWREQDAGLTFPKMFDDPEYYQHTYFGIFISCYHRLRSGDWFAVDRNNELVLKKRIAFVSDASRKKYEDKFYQEDQAFYYLRMLFNDLCKKARDSAPPSAIQDQADLRWSQYLQHYLTQDNRDVPYVTPPNLYDLDPQEVPK
jgi:hypothetical protein